MPLSAQLMLLVGTVDKVYDSFNLKMKTINILDKALIVGLIVGAAGAATILNAADPDDHTIVIRSAQTVEQIVSAELQSAKFAEQIASYNGFASAGAMLAVGATLAIPRPYLESIDFGRIAFVKGDVVHKQSDLVVNPPTKGSQIRNGDVFRTGDNGFVSLSFNSGARVNVQPDSRVLIKDIDCAKPSVKCVISVSATEGQVYSEIMPRPDGQPPVRFTVDTPFLTAAVRGTAFYVDVDDKENRIGVTKGLVATDSGGASNDLPRGKGLSAKPAVLPEIVDLLDPPTLDIQSEKLLVSTEDIISWSPLDGASSYKASIAADSDMAEPVNVQSTNTTSVTAELSPGDYHLTVAGVDDKQFIGLPARKQITFAEITDSQQPRIDILRTGNTVELTIPGQATAVQLLVGNSMGSNVFESTILDITAGKTVLELDADQQWVFRVRRILGAHKVSAYSDFYVLGAASK